MTGPEGWRGASVPLCSTFNWGFRLGGDCRRSTALHRLRAMAVVRRGSNAHAAKFIEVILPVKDVPLLAAFENLFLLRRDALAHLHFDLFFVFHRVGQNLHPLLPNPVPL